MPVAVAAEGVTHRYPNGNEALKGINLAITSGMTVALVGRNGSGKTTLAKHFNSLLKPTSGRVLVEGIDASSQSASEMARKVGYIFQNPEDQIFGSSILEEVTFGPKNLAMDKEQIEFNAMKALAMVGLQSSVSEHPYNLNYGQRKMLCLASVLAMDPRIIVMDEPNAGQDYHGLCLLGLIINQLKEKGKTIIVISHDMEFIARHCERTILMSDGEIAKDDSTRNVLSDQSKLRSYGIRPPQVTRLAISLSDHGVRHDLITVEEMVEELIKQSRRKVS